MTGLFVVIDGIDGCGKSTQALRLAEQLRARGCDVEHLREPGSTPFGEAVRRILLERDLPRSVPAEILGFFAARAELLAARIEPALARGASVVCERWVSSTYAYQSAGTGTHLPLVEALDRAVVTRAPDRLLVLDLPPATALGRLQRSLDGIEGRGEAYFGRVREGFLAYARRTPSARVIDAARPAEEVAASVLAEVFRAAS